jgi:hypothetical protein
VTPMTLGGLHGTRTIRTANFEMLVSPPSLGLAAQAIGCRSLLSSTPSGTGAEVKALVDRLSAIYILRAGNVLQAQDLEVLFQLASVEKIGDQLRIMATAISLVLDDELGVSFHELPHPLLYLT